MTTLRSALGLQTPGAFWRDSHFALAVVSPLVLWALVCTVPIGWANRAPCTFVSVLGLAVWQPLIEELFFRGWVQGELAATSWGPKTRYGITRANVATSFLFVAAHLLHHPALWAVAVLIPSMVFGYFRDKSRSVYPAVLLHSYYNLGFLFALQCNVCN